MTRPRSLSWLALVAAAALGAAGCGSTVAGAGSGTAPAGTEQGLVAPSPGSDGLSAPGAAAPGAAGTAAGSTAGGGTAAAAVGGGAAPAAGTARGTGTTGQVSGGGGTGATRAVAPGITDTTVYMGFAYSSQVASADRAIGAAGASPSYDLRNVVNAVVDYANSHGGFAGRKMKVLYYDENLTTPQDVQDQAECDYWTHDNKVFVLPGDSDVLRECAEKAGGISLGVGSTVASTYRKYPHLLDPFAVRLDRLGPMTANGLYRAGYFGGKLGFVTWDDPNFRYAYTHGYLPALASHGIKPTDEAFIKVPQTLDAVGEMSAAMSSVVTKFRSEGIDHVIIQDGHAGVWAGTGLTLEFMDQAESQKYFPRYGQNADNSPGWSGLPADQMDKALAILDSDYDQKFDEGWHTNQQREKCFKIEADAGYPVHSNNVNDEGLAAQACDYVFFTQLLMNQLATVTSDNLVRAVEGLGRVFKSAFVYGTEFGPGQHDGSAEVRQAEYFKSCKCLKYSGAPYYPG